MIKSILMMLASLLPFFSIAQPRNWQKKELQLDSLFGISKGKANMKEKYKDKNIRFFVPFCRTYRPRQAFGAIM